MPTSWVSGSVSFSAPQASKSARIALDVYKRQEKGRACHKQIEASIARFEDDLQSGIDPQQVAAARAVLEQTLRNAQHFLQEENTKQERGKDVYKRQAL